MPGQQIEPRTLTADEQIDIHLLLAEQRRLQDELHSTHLTAHQHKLLWQMFQLRILTRGVLHFDQAIVVAGQQRPTLPTESGIIARRKESAR